MNSRDRPSTPKKGGKDDKPRLRLHRDRPCGRELRKIALLQIDAALRELRGNNVASGPVHDARTYIKKVRAILKLSAASMRRKERDRLTRLLRKAAGRLAPVRDSEVRVRTLDSLLERANLPVERYASLREGLAGLAGRERLNAVGRIPEVLQCLRILRDLVAEGPWEDLHGKELKRRLRRTYRRGRISLELCRTKPDPEAFHRWRKQVKQLWYQLRITSEYWSSGAADLIETTGKIGELAGEERDLTLLAETLARHPRRESTARLRKKISERRSMLRREAVKAGLSLYGKRPGIFVEALDF